MANLIVTMATYDDYRAPARVGYILTVVDLEQRAAFSRTNFHWNRHPQDRGDDKLVCADARDHAFVIGSAHAIGVIAILANAGDYEVAARTPDNIALAFNISAACASCIGGVHRDRAIISCARIIAPLLLHIDTSVTAKINALEGDYRRARSENEDAAPYIRELEERLLAARRCLRDRVDDRVMRSRIAGAREFQDQLFIARDGYHRDIAIIREKIAELYAQRDCDVDICATIYGEMRSALRRAIE